MSIAIGYIITSYQSNIDRLDLELIIAHILKKPREFVLAHPEHTITKKQETIIKKIIERRINHEPLAYILGHKEFFGLDFKVTKHTLIPRPETELIVELATQNAGQLLTTKQRDNLTIIDIGTGSGNIIISLAKNLQNKKIKFFGTDISKEALQVAKYNSKKNKVNKKIKFIKSDLLNNKKIFKNLAIKQFNNLTIVANLPYLSKKVYTETLPNVKNFEPKSALYSSQNGLFHYKKLLSQIKTLNTKHKILNTFLEFSPEQKKDLHVLIKKILPKAKTEFKKDLAQKWRICIISL